MQKLLVDYLFKYKQCSLPQLGTLQIKNTPASSIFGEQKIAAPTPEIHFSDTINNSQYLQDYIAANKNITTNEAAQQLIKVVEDIKALQFGESIVLPGAGKFCKDEHKKITFIANKLPAYFLPAVHAERVIHPNESHTMLVGDTETSTTAMAEYFADDEQKIKSKWWIWALVFFGLSAAAIGFYASEYKTNSFFGVATKLDVKTADSTYQILP
jgi:hypothetical protein